MTLSTQAMTHSTQEGAQRRTARGRAARTAGFTLGAWALLVSACGGPPEALENEDAAPAEFRPDRSQLRRAEVDMEALVTPAMKAAMADAPGSITYEAPYDGEPVASTKTPEGLVIEDFVLGEGREVAEGSVAKLHYQGYLANGHKFDDSYARGQPIDVQVGKPGMITGFDQGIRGMKVGGKRRIEIPGALGYGATGRGPIPPDATLVFLLEAVEVSDPPPPPRGKEAFAGTPTRQEKRDDGLEIKVFAAGSGRKAVAGDLISVHYTGYLENGDKFDSSVDRGTPFTVPLGASRVIKGWDEGLVGSQKGELRKLVIPPDMAYGPGGRGKIPPNATLTFDIEIIDVSEGAPPRPSR